MKAKVIKSNKSTIHNSSFWDSKMVLKWAHFDKLHEINVASSLDEVKVSFWKKIPLLLFTIDQNFHCWLKLILEVMKHKSRMFSGPSHCYLCAHLSI